MPSTSFPVPPFLSHGSGVNYDPYILVLILFVIINATSMCQRAKYSANPHLVLNLQIPGTHFSSSPILPESLGNSSAPILPWYTVRLWITKKYFVKWSRSIPGFEKDLLSVHLPNALNVTFSFPLVILGIMLLYIPLFPPMYLHMFTQRKKVLGTAHKID